MNKFTLIIGNKNYSSWSMRPWILMQHFGIEFNEKIIYLKQSNSKQEIAQYSKNKKVPCLILDQDKNHSISDSLAICEYLAEKFPAKHLWPQAEMQRAEARAIVCEMHSGFMALRNTYNMNIKRKPQITDRQKRINNPELNADILRIEEIWNNLLAKQAPNSYLFGEFSIADAFFAPVALRFNSYDVELNQNSRNYINFLLQNESIKQWIEVGLQEEIIIIDYEV